MKISINGNFLSNIKTKLVIHIANQNQYTRESQIEYQKRNEI